MKKEMGNLKKLIYHVKSECRRCSHKCEQYKEATAAKKSAVAAGCSDECEIIEHKLDKKRMVEVYLIENTTYVPTIWAEEIYQGGQQGFIVYFMEKILCKGKDPPPIMYC